MLQKSLNATTVPACVIEDPDSQQALRTASLERYKAVSCEGSEGGCFSAAEREGTSFKYCELHCFEIRLADLLVKSAEQCLCAQWA